MTVPLLMYRLLRRPASGQFELDDDAPLPETMVVASRALHALPDPAQRIKVPLLPGEIIQKIILLVQLNHSGPAIGQHVLQGDDRKGLQLILFPADLLGPRVNLAGGKTHIRSSRPMAGTR
jgi:hypothetical protein